MQSKTVVEESTQTVSFKSTPPMSTYLVALVIGEFDHLEDHSNKGVPIRVYSPKGKSDNARFVLNVAVKALAFYESYFGAAYPLPKLDLVAVQDFGMGAMENWGLITYREADLLVDLEHTTTLRRQKKWWTHLWLNEG